MSKVRVCVLTLSASRSAGGLFFSVRSLSKALARDARFDVEVWSVEDGHTKGDRGEWDGVRLRIFPRSLRGKFGASIPLLVAASGEKFDVVHLHGVWNFMSVVARIFQMRGARIVVSPRGMYDKWILARSAILKRVFLSLVEGKLIRESHFLHALTDKEARSISDLGGRRVLVLPNGADLAFVPKDDRQHADETKCVRRRLVYIGRLHEKKGLIEFVSSWAQIPDVHRLGWTFDIYGWGDEAYVDSLAGCISKLGLSASVSLKGEVYGEAKSRVLEEADAFVLPTKSEGLPMAILEAWSFGVPCLMTSEANLPIGFAVGAASELSENMECWPDEISRFLLMYPENGCSMKVAALELVRERFDWKVIAERLGDAYVGDVSEFVRGV